MSIIGRHRFLRAPVAEKTDTVLKPGTTPALLTLMNQLCCFGARELSSPVALHKPAEAEAQETAVYQVRLQAWLWDGDC